MSVMKEKYRDYNVCNSTCITNIAHFFLFAEIFICFYTLSLSFEFSSRETHYFWKLCNSVIVHVSFSEKVQELDFFSEVSNLLLFINTSRDVYIDFHINCTKVQ